MPDRYAWAGTPCVPAATAGGSARSTDDARAVVVAANGASAEVSTARVSAATDARVAARDGAGVGGDVDVVGGGAGRGDLQRPLGGAGDQQGAGAQQASRRP